MAIKYSRKEVKERLKKEIENNRPVFMFGAGTGLTAKCAEIGGADLIGVYSTAFFRMHGVSSLMAWLPYSNANEELIHYSKLILPVVKKTPCIAGIGAHDPGIDIGDFIDRVSGMGFSGVSNEPFVGIYGKEFSGILNDAGIGFNKEVELVKIANKKNIFTQAWAFNEEEAAELAEAGADIIGAMIGLTAGGLIGAKKSISLDEAVIEVQKICNAVKKVNPETIIITHGGPFKDVNTAGYSIQNSDAVGYASGSSGERMPVEEKVVKITKEFKKINLK
jgi:predicted TIM-barrel enzyme